MSGALIPKLTNLKMERTNMPGLPCMDHLLKRLLTGPEGSGCALPSYADVMIVTPENIEKLEKVFKDMNTVSFRTETETEYTTVTDAHGDAILDGHGNPEVETTVTLYIYVNVTSMDYRDGAALCRFNTSQNEMLGEMMLPGYYPLFAELLGDMVGDGGKYGMGLEINPNLSPIRWVRRS